MDFNQAGAQPNFDVIPKGTIVVVQMNIRPGNVGEDEILKRSRDGESEGLDAEFIVVEGEYAKRRFWSRMLVSGTTDGHAQAADFTSRTLRAIIESAKGIKSGDVSEAAKAARDVPYSYFDGVRFMCKVDVEEAHDGYRAKNILPLGGVITPDDQKNWHPIEQQPKSAETKKAGGTDIAPVPIKKPDWAS
jgi:hypothetical protein